MKKSLFTFLFIIIGLSSINAQSLQKSEVKVVEKPHSNTTLTEEKIKERLNEIYELDLSTLSKEDRKELKNELKEMKEASGLDNRISISVGALIIILLLLIIIF